MRNALLLFSLLLVGAAPQEARKPGLSSKEKTQVKAILKRYFKEQDLEARDKILADLEPLDHPSKADVRTFAKTCFKYMRYGPVQRAKGSATCTDPRLGTKRARNVPQHPVSPSR